MIAAAPAPLPGSVPLPPSGRDFEIYRRTAVEGRTTREVAAEFNVSQTRVVQLRERVFDWMGMHLPPLARMSPADRLRVAETVACQQLQHQYDEAMEAWRNSHTAVHVTRFIGKAVEDGVTVVKESQGDPKYLRLATQISKAIARQGIMTMPDPETAIPVSGFETSFGDGIDSTEGNLIGEWGSGDADSHERSAQDHGNEQVAGALEDDEANHPVGDCSTSTSRDGASNDTALQRDGGSPVTLERCALPAQHKSSLVSRDEGDSGTVQTGVKQLENGSRVTRKMRRREARQQQKRHRGDLIATRTG